MPKLTRQELLEWMETTFTTTLGDYKPFNQSVVTVGVLLEILEKCGVLEQELRKYKAEDLERNCPVCNEPPGELCRASPQSGAKLPCPHKERCRDD